METIWIWNDIDLICLTNMENSTSRSFKGILDYMRYKQSIQIFRMTTAQTFADSKRLRCRPMKSLQVPLVSPSSPRRWPPQEWPAAPIQRWTAQAQGLICRNPSFWIHWTSNICKGVGMVLKVKVVKALKKRMWCLQEHLVSLKHPSLATHGCYRKVWSFFFPKPSWLSWEFPHTWRTFDLHLRVSPPKGLFHHFIYVDVGSLRNLRWL